MPLGATKDHRIRHAAPRPAYRHSLKIIQLLLALSLAHLNAKTALASDGQAAAPAACLKLGGDESLGPDAVAAFRRLFHALYAHAGLCETSVVMDPKRLEQLLDLGELDGDWFRPGGYLAERGKNLIRLPQPILALEARLIWLASRDFSGRPTDLRGLTVGYHAGFRWLEGHLPEMGATPFAVTSAAQIRGLLERGRIDVFATSSAHEPHVLAAFADDPSRVRDATWQAVPFFHLLAPAQADKAKRLNDALVAMIRSGEIREYLTMPGVIVMPVMPEPQDANPKASPAG